jgi:hypothetical protein
LNFKLKFLLLKYFRFVFNGKIKFFLDIFLLDFSIIYAVGLKIYFLKIKIMAYNCNSTDNNKYNSKNKNSNSNNIENESVWVLRDDYFNQNLAKNEQQSKPHSHHQQQQYKKRDYNNNKNNKKNVVSTNFNLESNSSNKKTAKNKCVHYAPSLTEGKY